MLEFLESPTFAIILALLLGALAVSGTFSQAWANTLLAGIFFVGSLSLMRHAGDFRLIAGGSLILAGFCFLVSYAIRQRPPISVDQTRPESKQDAPKNLHELFQKQLDFPKAIGTSQEYNFRHSAGAPPFCTVEAKLYADSTSRVRFMGFFIPQSCSAFEAGNAILEHYEKMRTELEDAFSIQSGRPGTNVEDVKSYPFSGRVVIYHEGDLTMRDKGTLDDLFTKRGFSLLFLDKPYLVLNYFKKQQ